MGQNDPASSFRSDSAAISVIRRVLSRALEGAFAEIAAFSTTDGVEPRWSEKVRDAWVRCLRNAFSEVYSEPAMPQRIAVFGGKPRDENERLGGLHSGVRNWARWEMLYDVSVVELKWFDAPYPPHNPVVMVKQAIWLVESEIARDATKVLEDFSKLRLGESRFNLFVAAQTLQKNKQPWLSLFSQATFGMGTPVYLALIPSYGSDQKDKHYWRQGTSEVMLYRCVPDGSPPEPVGVPIISADKERPTANL